MSLCDDCISGARHEGEPEGHFETIAGERVYVAVPKGDYDKSVVVLYLPDALGVDLSNNQLLVSDFAKNGFRTVAVDYFKGDAIPESVLENRAGFDLPSWVARHGSDVTRPIIDAVVGALKAEGVTKILAAGYCFGGRYSFDLAFEGIVDAVSVSHPSLLKIPDDLEKYKTTAKAPLLINSCSVDQQFPLESSTKADEILGNGQFAPGYKREFFDGCSHGFAVRADLSDPKQKAAKEGAFKSTILWFKEHL